MLGRLDAEGLKTCDSAFDKGSARTNHLCWTVGCVSDRWNSGHFVQAVEDTAGALRLIGHLVISAGNFKDNGSKSRDCSKLSLLAESTLSFVQGEKIQVKDNDWTKEFHQKWQEL